MKFKRLMSALLTLALVCSLGVSASAAELKGFSDVPNSGGTAWCYDAIMAMVQKGLFSGVDSPDKNGMAHFAPNLSMTNIQFIVVVTRYLYNDELVTMPKGEKWYSNNYDLALKNGLVKKGEFNETSLNDPMTRQQMARVIGRACAQLGEPTNNLIDGNKIPDFGKVGNTCKEGVRIAYSKGILCGVDSKGTFLPNGTLTRAQAATVLYRLVEPSTRKPVDLGNNSGIIVDQDKDVVQGQTQEFREGSSHAPAKEGDVVIKADGTKVVLKKTNGVLGAYQGVDCLSGTVINGFTFEMGMAWTDGSKIQKDAITGEVHSGAEWVYLMKHSVPSKDGTKDGEIQNTWYKWYAAEGIWNWIGPGR